MTTLATYRQSTAPELGEYVGPPAYAPLATSGSSTSQLEDTAYPIFSRIRQDDRYKDFAIYRPAAAAAGDKHRIVKDYTSASGLIVPDKTWTNTPNGEAYELLGMFDAATLHNLINEGLKRCWMVVETTLAVSSATATRQSLASLTWLTNPTDVYQVGFLASGESRETVDPFSRRVRGSVTKDHGTLYLNHFPRSFNTTDTLYLRVLKPAYYECAPSAGAFGDQSGLSLETDKCPAEVDWVVASTLVIAWRRFGHMLEASASARLIRDRAEAAAWFTTTSQDYFAAHLPDRTFRPMSRFGPARR